MERRRMTGDHYDVGQTTHVGHRATRPAPRAAGVLSAVVPVLLTALVAALLAGCSGSPANARTTVVDARAATVVTPSGATQSATPNLRLVEGTLIRTGRAGSAILATGGRMLYLGGSSEYVVGSGVSGELRSGAAVVDARHGPDIRLAAGQIAVHTDHAAIRVERGFSVRVGVFAGSATVATVPGTDDTTVSALHQVVVAGRRIPAQTPLVLTDDEAEQRVALTLVQDDERLNTFAHALDRSRIGRQLVAVAAEANFPLPFSTASFDRRGLPISELALPVAMARAAVGAHASVADMRNRYVRIRGYRTAGGSWGVVAHLAGTDADGTAAAMNVLLPRLAGVTPVSATPGNTSGGQTTPGGRPTGNGPGPSTSPSARPTGSSPGPSPSPSPSPSPTGSVLNDLVGTVSGLVSPTPAPHAGSGQSRPHPQPTCLLLGLVCS